MNEDFFSVFIKKIKRILKKNLFEIVLISLSLVFFLTTLIVYFKTLNFDKTKEDFEDEEVINSEKTPTTIFVDVSGAVKKPGLYQLKSNDRLKEAVEKAGGLSDEADPIFFQRNFNLAQILHDQEKIYIPTIEEVNLGLVDSQIIPYQTLVSQNKTNTVSAQESSLININSATADELDQLPGVGPVTSQKIIDNRPYQSIDELLNKKIVNKSVYEKIKNQITL